MPTDYNVDDYENFEDLVKALIIGTNYNVITTDGTTFENSHLLQADKDGITVRYGWALVFVAPHELEGMEEL